MLTVLIIWTAVVVGLFLLFMATVKGEETMGIPIVFMISLIAIVCPWMLHGFYNLIQLLF